MREKKRNGRQVKKVCVLFKRNYFSLDINIVTDTVSNIYTTEFPTVTSQEDWILEQIKKQTLMQATHEWMNLFENWFY